MGKIISALSLTATGRFARGVCLVSILSGSGHALAAQVEARAIMDNNGGTQPMVAATIAMPQNWQSQGGVVWGVMDSCNRYGYNFDWRANSPDGNYGIMILPQVYWSSNPSPTPGLASNCVQGSFAEARQFLEWYVSNTLPEARIVDYRPRPDLLEVYRQYVGKTDYGTFSMTNYADAGEITLAFNQNGKEMLGLIVVTIKGTVTDMDMWGTPDIQNSAGVSLPIFAAYAPREQFDANAVESIRKTITPDPQWMKLIQQHQAKIDQLNTQGAVNRNRTISNTYNEIGDIINDGYNKRNAIQDRMQRETIEAIRGVETYSDPVGGGTVELDNTNNNAWRLNDGSYATTNDPSFNPYENFGMGGQEMQPLE